MINSGKDDEAERAAAGRIGATADGELIFFSRNDACFGYHISD